MIFTPAQRARLSAGAAAAGAPLGDADLDRFDKLAAMLLAWNEKFNLTALKTVDAVVDKHFLDSLWGHARLPAKGLFLDIGTGAGFPGIPLKIAGPGRRLVLIDGTAKKIGFVNAAVKELGLDNISGLHQRAEDQAFQFGLAGHVDGVTARAVAATDELARLAKPFLKVGGLLLLYKGVDEAQAVAGRSFPGYKGATVSFYELPEGDKRALVELRRA
jgi:16S rRNA (guanine527-N7)-methyltransferase